MSESGIACNSNDEDESFIYVTQQSNIDVSRERSYQNFDEGSV